MTTLALDVQEGLVLMRRIDSLDLLIFGLKVFVVSFVFSLIFMGQL